jgi:hypothetical protein
VSLKFIRQIIIEYIIEIYKPRKIDKLLQCYGLGLGLWTILMSNTNNYSAWFKNHPLKLATKNSLKEKSSTRKHTKPT